MEKGSKSEMQDNTMSRRTALKVIAATGGTIALGTWLAACGSSSPGPIAKQGNTEPAAGSLKIDLTQPDNQPLNTVGGALALDSNIIDAAGVLLVRETEASVLAFSRKCTHLGCPIAAMKGGLAVCPCHGSEFNMKGQPVRGPAKNSLKQYSAALNGKEVIISNAS
jgi:Rieske Fe-S protein